YRTTFREVSFARVADVSAFVLNSSYVRAQQTCQNFNQRRFARSVWPNDQVKPGGCKRYRNIRNQRLVAGAKSDVACRKHQIWLCLKGRAPRLDRVSTGSGSDLVKP